MKFPAVWGATYPPAGKTPTRMISLYVNFFGEGNFHLPMTKFVGDLLTRYGIHIS
ncbi:hypothetical protein Hanom_Chr06g00556411 [Helianthus anomalus]